MRSEWSNVKARLTRAKNSGDPHKVMEACEQARATFDRIGWPDWWTLVDRMESDAYFDIQRKEAW